MPLIEDRNRPSDHNPRPGDRVVCAIDIRGVTTARAVWEHLLRTKDPRVKYAIFDRRIVHATNRPWIVRSYSGVNAHADHLHLSVGRGPDGRSTGPVDDTTPWGLSTPRPQEDDVPQWARQAIAWARQLGISDGSRPNDPVTRAECITMLHRLAERGGKASGWAEFPPENIMSPKRPNALITRAEVATALKRLMGR